MKAHFSLLALLAALSPAMAGTTVSQVVVENKSGLYDGRDFHALGFTSGEGGLESIILSSDGTANGNDLDLTGNGTLYGTDNANQNGMNLYFDGTGTTTITGAKLNNSKAAGANNTTRTYYAFVVASGEVVFDVAPGENGSSIDLKQNLSIGTAWTNYNTDASTAPATLTITNGSKIETTAYYNAVGSNGSKGTINVEGAGSQLATQQITLGAGTAGLTSAPSPGSDAYYENPDNGGLYWYPANFYDDADYQNLVSSASNIAKGYGEINIKGGAVMSVGEGNTKDTSNNKLQIFNGAVNISGKDGEGNASTLVLNQGGYLTMDPNYKAPAPVDDVFLNAINISEGGCVRMDGDEKLAYFSMGLAYDTNRVDSSISVDGEGSSFDIAVSESAMIGGQASSSMSSGETASTLSATNGGDIHINADGGIYAAYYGKGTKDSFNISATGGGSIHLESASEVSFGVKKSNDTDTFSAEITGNITASGVNEKTGDASVVTITGKTIFINPTDNASQQTTITADQGGTVNLNATESVYLGPHSEVSVKNGSTLTTTGRLTVWGASVSIDESSTWTAAEVILRHNATITNYGEMSISSLTHGENTTFVNEGSMSVTGGATFSATSQTTYVVTGQDAPSLTSTTVNLGDGASFSLEDGAVFHLDFTQSALNAPGRYEGVELVLVTGISDTDAEALLSQGSLDTLLSNTSFDFADGLQAAELTDLAYSIQNGSLLLSGSFSVVPEPATATLSLLALAALAARRRRR